MVVGDVVPVNSATLEGTHMEGQMSMDGSPGMLVLRLIRTPHDLRVHISVFAEGWGRQELLHLETRTYSLEGLEEMLSESLQEAEDRFRSL